eukprot:Gb_06700 [translate_table: standard]
MEAHGHVLPHSHEFEPRPEPASNEFEFTASEPALNSFNFDSHPAPTQLRGKNGAAQSEATHLNLFCAGVVKGVFGFRYSSKRRFFYLGNLVGQALFGDGAAAVIGGADPIPEVEKPSFQLLWTSQTILPDSDGAIEGHLREVGLTFHLLDGVPSFITDNIEKSLVEAFQQFGISDWNRLFWITHPGGRSILDHVASKLKLNPFKMRATRHVLSEYWNMSSACVFFILDEMRQSYLQYGCSTTGEGLEWGVLFGFGPASPSRPSCAHTHTYIYIYNALNYNV